MAEVYQPLLGALGITDLQPNDERYWVLRAAMRGVAIAMLDALAAHKTDAELVYDEVFESVRRAAAEAAPDS